MCVENEKKREQRCNTHTNSIDMGILVQPFMSPHFPFCFLPVLKGVISNKVNGKQWTGHEKKV